MDEGELEDWKNQKCILKADLEYPLWLHDLHNDYPLAPESINVGNVEKLIPDLKRASQPISNISRQGLKIRFLSYLKHCWAKVWQKQRYMFWGKISLYSQEKRK